MPAHRILALWLLIVLSLCGCADPVDSVAIDRVTIDGQPHVLPMHLPVGGAVDGEAALPRDQPYQLRAHVELPAALRGQPADLSIPLFQAQVYVEADGHPLLPTASRPGYRVAAPQRWRIPAAATADGELELLFTVDHSWTQSAWLTTRPLVLPVAARDPTAYAVELVNLYGGWVAIGALMQIGLTCLLVFFLDRRRRAYLWFGIQVLTAVVYPAHAAGLTVWLGKFDIVLVELGLVVALLASIHFTHSFYEWGPPPRWVVWLLGASGLLSLVILDPYLVTQTSARAVVCAVVLATGYQLWMLGRHFVRDPERRVSLGLVITAWLVLAFGTWADMLVWFGGPEQFGGVRPASIGLTGYALFLSLLLSRSHIRLLGRADELNADLAARVAELDAERARVVSLNQDLRLQIADRSAQLFSALSLIQTGDRRRTSLAVGSEVDNRYRVERVLGAGAMGMVYEVTRLSDRTRWAMKVATGVSGDDLARLAREAHIASKLDHDNVVAIRDIDVSTMGFLYIVLELVEGESLRQRLEQGPLAPRVAAPILVQIARGLAAMHEAGVAHRDLKPDNVLIAERNGRLQVKIADFGISRLGGRLGGRSDAAASSLPAQRELPLIVPEPKPKQEQVIEHEQLAGTPAPADAITMVEATNADEATAVEQIASPDVTDASQRHSHSSSLDLTGTGMLAGTPHYVAPELALGAAPNDVRADLYSFGVLAFELLGGERPYAVPVAVSLRDGDEPVERRALKLGDEHRELVAVVERCLSFDPQQRPTAQELIELLREQPPAATP